MAQLVSGLAYSKLAGQAGSTKEVDWYKKTQRLWILPPRNLLLESRTHKPDPIFHHRGALTTKLAWVVLKISSLRNSDQSKARSAKDSEKADNEEPLLHSARDLAAALSFSKCDGGALCMATFQSKKTVIMSLPIMPALKTAASENRE